MSTMTLRVSASRSLQALGGQLYEVNPAAGGDFAGDDGDALLHHGFASHAGARILSQDRVENGVGNLVGNLVRMAFGHRLRGKEVVAHRGKYPSFRIKR